MLKTIARGHGLVHVFVSPHTRRYCTILDPYFQDIPGFEGGEQWRFLERTIPEMTGNKEHKSPTISRLLFTFRPAAMLRRKKPHRHGTRHPHL
jgi:hypothetical protein